MKRSIFLTLCLFSALSIGFTFVPVSPQIQDEETSPLSESSWVRLGGPSGGLGYDIRMRPDDPTVMFVTDAWAGVHKSMDGGRTWLPSNDGITGRQGDSGDAIPSFCLTIDPNDHDILWAGLQNLGELYRSADGGQTWEKRVSGIVERDGLSFRGISVEPGNSNVVYAAGEIGPWKWAGRDIRGLAFDLTKGVLYKSIDGGLHWQAIWRGDNLARYIWIDPKNVNTLYLSTGIFDREAANSNPQSKEPGGMGILKSTDGGKTWNQINEGFRNLYIGSLFMDPENPEILLAGAGNNSYREGSGVYLTVDGGMHWQLVMDTSPVAVTSVEFSESDPNIAYAGGQHVFAVSTDGGRTWQRRDQTGRWGPPGIAPGFPIDFQVEPRNPERIFANNYGGGNFLSEDGGRTWSSASTGYTGADLRSLSIHPSNPALVYTNGRSGPFVSRDGGLHWQGINPANLDSIVEGSQIILDPRQPDHVVMTESNRDLIYWSDDGGQTWNASTNDWAELTQEFGRFIGGVEALAFAPSDPERLYAVFGNNSCRGMGTFCDSPGLAATFAVSEDGGRSWSRRTSLPDDRMPGTAVAVDPNDANRVWVALPASGIFRSLDGGATWQPAGQGLGSAKALSLAVDLSNGVILYAGTLTQGVYKSLDGGTTWRQSGKGMDPNEPIFTIVIDPARPNVIYAGSMRSGVYWSDNGGQDWKQLNSGLRTRAVHTLAISSDGETLYAATRGEGAFRLSTHGQDYFDSLAPTPTAILPISTAIIPTSTPAARRTSDPDSPIASTSCPGATIAPFLMLAVFWLRRRER